MLNYPLKIASIAVLVLVFSTPVLAGGLVYDLDSNRIYKVERDGDSTRVYNLGPGEPSVTIGRRLPSGNSLVIQSPSFPRDETAKGLAGDNDYDSEDGD